MAMDAERIRHALGHAKSEDDLVRLYRAISKRAHPDTGGSHESFVALAQEYDAAMAALRAGEVDAREPAEASANAAPAPDAFDPYAVIRDMGYAILTDPRGCLYVAIARYKTGGLYARKVRVSRALRSRNIAIIRTILYWARAYDPDFAEIFLAYDRRKVDGLSTTARHRAAWDLKRWLDSGYTHFMEYEEYGRPMTERLARGNLESVLETIEINHLDRDGDKAFAAWLLRELDKPPALLKT